jgi:hypothetical protein
LFQAKSIASGVGDQHLEARAKSVETGRDMKDIVMPKVWVFFYGSYINFEVLKEVDLVPGRVGGRACTRF